jgi:hypothetical protein
MYGCNLKFRRHTEYYYRYCLGFIDIFIVIPRVQRCLTLAYRLTRQEPKLNLNDCCFTDTGRNELNVKSILKQIRMAQIYDC